MSDNYGKIDRTRDLYRVHDAAKKQKKEKKGQLDNEFLNLLEESEKDAEGYDEGKRKEQKPTMPTSSMLDKLSAGAPPPIIIHDDSAESGKKE